MPLIWFTKFCCKKSIKFCNKICKFARREYTCFIDLSHHQTHQHYFLKVWHWQFLAKKEGREERRQIDYQNWLHHHHEYSQKIISQKRRVDTIESFACIKRLIMGKFLNMWGILKFTQNERISVETRYFWDISDWIFFSKMCLWLNWINKLFWKQT